MPMRLELEDGTTINDPAPEVLEAALHSLRVPGRAFAILESGPGSYMQTAKNDDGSFELEYQEGDLTQHYHLTGSVDVVEVTEAFRSYRSGTAVWRRKYDWQKLVLNYKK